MSKRSYRQVCGVAKALDVVGERWTLLIVRNLLVGGQRYKDLLETLPGITTNLLAERLQKLSADGLIAARELPPPVKTTLYELTALGRELEPVILALGGFGARHFGAAKRGDHSHVRWAMVSIKRRYRPGRPERGSLTLCVDGEHSYRFVFDAAALDVTEGPAQAQDAVRVSMSGAALRALLFQGASARALARQGELRLDGEPRLFYALVSAIGAAP